MVLDMNQIWIKIHETARLNNGFIKASQVEQFGVSRPLLPKYTDMGKLARYIERFQSGAANVSSLG